MWDIFSLDLNIGSRFLYSQRPIWPKERERDWKFSFPFMSQGTSDYIKRDDLYWNGSWPRI